MKQIRCAVVASYYGPYYSNFVASLYAFNEMMIGNNNYVVYVFPKEVEQFEWVEKLQETNKIYYLDYNPYSFNNFKALRKIFKTEKINLIYSHMCGWDFTAHFAAPFTPIIWHMRMGVDNVNRKKRIKNWIKFNILGFGKTYHIAVSQPVTDAINSFKPHNKCVTIRNALDFSRITPKTNTDNSKQTKEILLFGWQPQVKGLDITLDACEKIINDGERIKLLVSSQEVTYEYINQRYDKAPDWLELLEPTSDVSSLYNRADIMVSASRSEGFSFALAEAIYSGLVTVVSDIPGTSWSSEFCARYEFASGDADSLKTALETALNHNITEDDQNNNRLILEQKYSMNVWVDAVYKELNFIFNGVK